MSGENMTPEQTAKAEIINDRLNTILLETRTNLNTILEINSIILGEDLACEGKSEKELMTPGWFNNVIDALKAVNMNNNILKSELAKLRKEFKE